MNDVYLDHAATSWPKPDAVVAAVVEWFTDLGVSAERGDSSRCAEVARRVRAARAGVAGLCHVATDRVAFTSGATEGLNLLLRGVLQRADHVVTSAIEHSSLVRPLVALGDELGIETTVVPCDRAGVVDPADVAAALDRRGSRLLAISHGSNVTGAVQDLAPMVAAAHATGALVLVDASQTAGVLPLPADADMLVASAHKGLLAPPGLGFVAVREGLELRTSKQGGTGSSTVLSRHPTTWPAAFEAGTPNTPAILGLAAALQWRTRQSPDAALTRAAAVIDQLATLVERRAGARSFRPAPGDERHLPILSFVLPTLDPAEAGLLLDQAGIHARTGFHCAPWIHRHLETAQAGTIRLSAGPFVSEDAPRRVADALGL